jgi:hypothetical protein
LLEQRTIVLRLKKRATEQKNKDRENEREGERERGGKRGRGRASFTTIEKS